MNRDGRSSQGQPGPADPSRAGASKRSARRGAGKGRATGGTRGGGTAKRSPRSDGVDETVSQLSGPLQKVLGRLPETQRKVLELRMGLADGHPHDLADTARSLGLSLSEARDIEKRAFEHIREAVPLQQLQRFLDR